MIVCHVEFVQTKSVKWLYKVVYFRWSRTENTELINESSSSCDCFWGCRWTSQSRFHDNHRPSEQSQGANNAVSEDWGVSTLLYLGVIASLQLTSVPFVLQALHPCDLFEPITLTLKVLEIFELKHLDDTVWRGSLRPDATVSFLFFSNLAFSHILTSWQRYFWPADTSPGNWNPHLSSHRKCAIPSAVTHARRRAPRGRAAARRLRALGAAVRSRCSRLVIEWEDNNAHDTMWWSSFCSASLIVTVKLFSLFNEVHLESPSPGCFTDYISSLGSCFGLFASFFFFFFLTRHIMMSKSHCWMISHRRCEGCSVMLVF